MKRGGRERAHGYRRVRVRAHGRRHGHGHAALPSHHRGPGGRSRLSQPEPGSDPEPAGPRGRDVSVESGARLQPHTSRPGRRCVVVEALVTESATVDDEIGWLSFSVDARTEAGDHVGADAARSPVRLVRARLLRARRRPRRSTPSSPPTRSTSHAAPSSPSSWSIPSVDHVFECRWTWREEP